MREAGFCISLTAYYLDIRGRERSAGSFGRKKDADDAWKDAEASIRAGRRGDPSRGKRLFESYVLDEWLPHHQLEPGVRSEYARQIRKHLLPFFGPMRMRDIMPEQVRQWVTALQAQGVRPRTIQYCKVSILNAIFTTALADEVVTIHPSRGVKTPPVPKKPSPGGSLPPPNSISSTRHCRTRMPGSWWRPTSRAACAGES